MPLYVGLGVSQETGICVVDGDGRRTWRGKCPSRPASIAEVLRQHAPDAVKIGTGSGLIRSLGAACCHAAWIRRALSRSSFARP